MGLLSLVAPVLVSCLLYPAPAWTCTVTIEKCQLPRAFLPVVADIICSFSPFMTFNVLPLEVQIQH